MIDRKSRLSIGIIVLSTFSKVMNRHILNPGFLRYTFSLTAPHALWTTDNGKWAVFSDHAPYNNQAFSLSYEKFQIPYDA
ncbi:hypothetical protein MKX29_04060 [Cytobacillus sp. FSL R7-0696]|uniref:hypothetical protein n=1 Tax=Cytobacillus sp. FSL R7-0696 TaxID=2921691 RepID=UPI0030FB443D